jgi:hypothetical protein
MTTQIVILVLIAVAAIAFAVVMYMQRERTRRLHNKFGSEYDRLVQDRGDRRKAEAELLDRQKRIEKFSLRELSPGEVDRFTTSWRNIQAEFVDAPREAVAHADRLVQEVMTTRGYPMSNFEQRAADISVDHPRVVDNYRSAHAIAERDSRGQANTEDLRQAMVHYRALFEDLLPAAAQINHIEEVKR